MKKEIPDVLGVVTYDVVIRCPHCGKVLHLTVSPYDDCDTCPDLVAALFGTEKKFARWSGINIGYTCFYCDGKFRLTGFET